MVNQVKKKYKICKFCIMDTSDPNIFFNKLGKCSHCLNFEKNILPNWKNNINKKKLIYKLSEKIKERNKKNEFDCIIGLSGGLDSSFVTHIAVKELNLKPLLFHVDAGWNTDKAVWNIEKLVDGLGLDLYTEVYDWESIKKMQLAFLKSGIADQDLVQDAAFFSGLYKFTKKFGIKDIITGSNFLTECCREPEAWGGFLGIDKWLFEDIYKKYGESSKINFPIIDILEYKIYYPYFKNIRINYLLNYWKYSKRGAEKLLSEKYDWKPFQHKHHESRFTRFYEDFWLPKKFGFEKRRAHFSSLIMTKQMNRKDALKRISKPELSKKKLKNEFTFVANKLDLTEHEFIKIFNEKNKSFSNYKNKSIIIKFGAKILRFLGFEKRNLL